MLGWSNPVGMISLGFSDEETNKADVWVSGAGEACELCGLGGSWSVEQNQVCLTKLFFFSIFEITKILYVTINK